jgi:hypothetical protein
VSAILHQEVPVPVHERPELHPSWCDPLTCVVEPNFGDGATHYVHTRVFLRERSPRINLMTGEPDGELRVEVFRSDLRRNVDNVLIDTWAAPIEFEPTHVYVDGLDQADLDGDVAVRVASALSSAAAIVASTR